MAYRLACHTSRSAWLAITRWSTRPGPVLHGHTFCSAAPETPIKYALIQGSSRGIGLQIVTQLLERPEYRCGPLRTTYCTVKDSACATTSVTCDILAARPRHNSLPTTQAPRLEHSSSQYQLHLPCKGALQTHFACLQGHCYMSES